jgi:3-phenylpropionate/trans-cinnamate dioxygenase ferredoxin reductase subunit
MQPYRYVILGGGLTAGYAAQRFAGEGINAGELLILSAEETLPYERPPLSKSFLAGEKTTDDILINDPTFYEENEIEVKLATPVTRVNLDEKRLYTNGESITYDKLLIATGARPNTFDLPGSDLDNIFYLRRVDDARQIRQAADEGSKAVAIGGSFIAMEATSVLQSQGIETTMIFPEERVWEEFFTPAMSAFFERYYRERGVTILHQREIESFDGDGSIRHVVTSRGEMLATDMIVAGIGVQPNSSLFNGTDLQIEDDYVVVNRFLETNMPDVLAAGDVARYRDVVYGRPLQLEHWDNAVNQGRHAAGVMMGEYRPYERVPYFFSDVFDLSYEFWGDATGAAEAVHRGQVEDGCFSVWWLAEDGRLLAAFVMNRPEEERELAPKWIQSREKLAPARLQDDQELR